MRATVGRFWVITEVISYIGQKYSVRERLENVAPGKQPWKFKKLGNGDEDELRSIFVRVLTDVIVQEAR